MSKYWTEKTDNTDTIYAKDFNDAFKNIADDMSAKVDKVTGKGLSTNDYTNAEKAEVAKISNKVDKATGKGLSANDYTDSDKAEVAKIKDKVDKVEGKGLSTNDFTNNYKSKLDALNQNLSNKASCSSVLMTIVPNDPFTPTSDYHPATKKYVDDSVASKVGSLSNLTTNEKTSIVAAINELKAAIDALKGS